MTETILPQQDTITTPVPPTTAKRHGFRHFIRSQAPSQVDRSAETPVDHDHHSPTTQNSPELQLQPNEIATMTLTSHTQENIHDSRDQQEAPPEDSNVESHEEPSVREQAGTINSETPSEKVTTEVTKANTVKNQFSLRAIGDELNKYIAHTFTGKKSKSKKKKKSQIGTLPRPNEVQLDSLLTYFQKHGLMFPFPGQTTHYKEGVAKRWRFWATKVVTNSSDGLMSEYKTSLTRAREYKKCKSTGWDSFKKNMDLIAQIMSSESQDTAVTHVLQRGFYPTDIDVFQNSLTLYLPVQRNRINVLTDALSNIIGNEDDYVFYDKEFDISKFRQYIIGITFLKTLSHITIKIWIQPVMTSRYNQTYFREDNTKMIQNLCQLLYDSSEGELGQDIASCMYCDNRLVMDTPYVFPQLYRGRAKL